MIKGPWATAWVNSVQKTPQGGLLFGTAGQPLRSKDKVLVLVLRTPCAKTEDENAPLLLSQEKADRGHWPKPEHSHTNTEQTATQLKACPEVGGVVAIVSHSGPGLTGGQCQESGASLTPAACYIQLARLPSQSGFLLLIIRVF